MRPIIWMWVIVIEHPLDQPRCKTKNCWNSIDTHFWGVATSVLLVFVTTKTSNTFSLVEYDYAAIWLPKIKDNTSVMLIWLVLAKVPDCRFRSRSRSELNWWQIGSLGHQQTWTVISRTVRWQHAEPVWTWPVVSGFSSASIGGFIYCSHVHCLIIASNQNWLFYI